MHLAVITLAAGSSSPSGLGALGINTWAFVSQLLSFIIVLVILSIWVLPPIQKMLAKRQDQIREGIENAEKAKQDLIEASKKAEQVIQEARLKAQDTIERASRNAEQIGQQIEKEARVRAEKIYQQNEARIQQEANRARIELSRAIVNLSIDAAGSVIGRSIDSKDNRRLVEEFVTASDQSRNN
jgi:ATP synthase, F0 subunit b